MYLQDKGITEQDFSLFLLTMKMAKKPSVLKVGKENSLCYNQVRVEKSVYILERIDCENSFERYSRVLVKIRLSQNSTKTRWNKLN